MIQTETGVGQPVFREHTFSGQTGLHEKETPSPSPRGEALPQALSGTSLKNEGNVAPIVEAAQLVEMNRLSTQCDEA